MVSCQKIIFFTVYKWFPPVHSNLLFLEITTTDNPFSQNKTKHDFVVHFLEKSTV